MANQNKRLDNIADNLGTVKINQAVLRSEFNLMKIDNDQEHEELKELFEK
jgi:hypothetical protein